MQGGGFAGTIQAYVPGRLLERYHTAIEQVFGQGSCYVLRLREQGAVRVI
jgi:galactokinase